MYCPQSLGPDSAAHHPATCADWLSDPQRLVGSVQKSTAAAACQCTQHSEPLTALRRPGHRCAHTEHRVLLVSGEEALQENEGRPPVDDASIPGRVHVARASWEKCPNCTCQSVQRYCSEVPPVDIHLPNPPVPPPLLSFFSN